MSRPPSLFTTAFQYFTALLVVLWPMMCCCGFGCGGSQHGALVVLAEHHHSDDHRNLVESRVSWQYSGGQHEGNRQGHHPGGSDCCNHGNGPSNRGGREHGCNCAKSQSTLTKVDASSLATIALESLFTWVSASTVLTPRFEHWTKSFGIDPERPAPPSLYALRVLRI